MTVCHNHNDPLHSHTPECVVPAEYFTPTTTVESIRRLEVNPGETLVMTVKDEVRREAFDEVWRRLEGWFPEGVRVVVTTNNVDFTVIARGGCTCGAKP